MISTEEIKNVKSINLENKDLTNADLAGLSEAVNCEKIDLENNKNITDISFIKNLKQVKNTLSKRNICDRFYSIK